MFQLKKYKICNNNQILNNQIGGKKLKSIINFPFEFMNTKHSKINIKWTIGDKDKGEKLPTTDFRNFYSLIKQILFYKEGWGTKLPISYVENDEEPCVLIAQLKSDVYIYIYSTSDYSGYECMGDYFDVVYSHRLEDLYKYGLPENVRKMLNITK